MPEAAEFANPAEPPVHGSRVREAGVHEPRTGGRQIGTPSDAGPSGDGRATSRPPRANGTTGATGRGVIALIVGATAIGGLADMAISGHRGHLFGVLFAVASAVGALVVRRRDLATAMVAPPLLYCVLIGAMSLIDQGGLSGGLLTREAFYLGNAFVTGAPAIWTGTALALGIGWYRKKSSRAPNVTR